MESLWVSLGEWKGGFFLMLCHKFSPQSQTSKEARPTFESRKGTIFRLNTRNFPLGLLNKNCPIGNYHWRQESICKLELIDPWTPRFTRESKSKRITYQLYTSIYLKARNKVKNDISFFSLVFVFLSISKINVNFVRA